jgi:WD40 repeat protein
LALHRDLATGNHLRILTGHTGQVRGVAFSPDGRLLATGSGDGSAWLWDWLGLPLRIPVVTTAVEGNVCRVKAIKRSRYGRAKLDLLRKIILCPG